MKIQKKKMVRSGAKTEVETKIEKLLCRMEEILKIAGSGNLISPLPLHVKRDMDEVKRELEELVKTEQQRRIREKLSKIHEREPTKKEVAAVFTRAQAILAQKRAEVKNRFQITKAVGSRWPYARSARKN